MKRLKRIITILVITAILATTLCSCSMFTEQSSKKGQELYSTVGKELYDEAEYRVHITMDESNGSILFVPLYKYTIWIQVFAKDNQEESCAEYKISKSSLFKKSLKDLMESDKNTEGIYQLICETVQVESVAIIKNAIMEITDPKEALKFLLKEKDKILQSADQSILDTANLLLENYKEEISEDIKISLKDILSTLKYFPSPDGTIGLAKDILEINTIKDLSEIIQNAASAFSSTPLESYKKTLAENNDKIAEQIIAADNNE